MWHVALRRGHADVAQLLLDVGADSDVHSAPLLGQVEVAEVRSALMPVVDIRCNFGNSAS
jgi:hypothetical protein